MWAHERDDDDVLRKIDHISLSLTHSLQLYVKKKWAGSKTESQP